MNALVGIGYSPGLGARPKNVSSPPSVRNGGRFFCGLCGEQASLDWYRDARCHGYRSWAWEHGSAGHLTLGLSRSRAVSPASGCVGR